MAKYGPPSTSPVVPRNNMDLIDIDPNGKVILKVGSDDDVRRVRVSKEFLAAVSPVFKAMLRKGRFAEGATSDGENGKEVCLPKDSATAMLAYLKMCHHQHEVLESLSSSDVRDLLEIIEKYQSMTQFRMLIVYWLRSAWADWPRRIGGDLIILLDVAFVVKEERTFRAMSQFLSQSVKTSEDPTEKAMECPADINCE